ncbi:MAG: hypothetical protein SynsKO_42160 [Synoicihabitans sp.]
MKIKTILLLTAAVAFIASTASAQITITISPINGDANNYLLQASGTGDTSTATINFGDLILNGNAFITVAGLPQAGLTFGGEAVTNAAVASTTTYRFAIANSLASGSSYGFSGGSTVVALTATYEATFNPGSYTIDSGNFIFGSNPTGTFTVLSSPSPVPEPSTYAAIGGIAVLGVALLRRRRK